MSSYRDVKKLTRKELIQLIEGICLDYSDELYLKHDIEFTFDHYDNDLKVVFLRESEQTKNPVTYNLLVDLTKDLKNINKRMQISIFYENLPAVET